MLLFNNVLSLKILIINSTAPFIVLILIYWSFFRRKAGSKDISKKKGGVNKNGMKERDLRRRKHKKVEFKTIVIEQPEKNNELDRSNLEPQKKESLLVPLKIKNQIEKIILKTLYEEKAIATLKLLNDKVLEVAAKQKITISEKAINLIIDQMNKIEIIEFTQKEGWKIKI